MAAAEETPFKRGQLVWAKMRGFPFWPAMIIDEAEMPESARSKKKNGSLCVRFFGEGSLHGTIPVEDILPYFRYREKYNNSIKKKDFVASVIAVEQFVEQNPDVCELEPNWEESGGDNSESTVFNKKSATNSMKKEPQTRDVVEKKTRSKREVKRELDGDQDGGPSPKRRAPSRDNSLSPGVSVVPKPRILRGSVKIEENALDIGQSSVSKRASAPAKSPIRVKDAQSPKLQIKIKSPTPSPKRATPESQQRFIGSPKSISPKNESRQRLSASPPKPQTSPKNGQLVKMEDIKLSLSPQRSIQQPLDESLKTKEIGWIGLGTIGIRFAKRLIDDGFKMVLYDRSLQAKIEKDEFFDGVPTASNAADLMKRCDVVFCCITDVDESRQLVFETTGIMESMGKNKAFVEMTTIDPMHSIDCNESIKAKEGRYLEAPLCGLLKDIELGHAVFTCAGDKTLFDECCILFKALGRRAVYFGEAGNGAKLRMLHQMLTGIITGAVAEISVIGARSGLALKDLDDIIGHGSPMACRLVRQVLNDISVGMSTGVYKPKQKLGQLQKEMMLASHFSAYEMGQPAFITSAAAQLFALARSRGEEMNDAAAVYRTLFADGAGTSTQPSSIPQEGSQQSGN